MPQQLLDAAQIGARLQQVAGKGMAQDMGVQANWGATQSAQCFDARLNGPGRQTGPPGGQKQGVGVGLWVRHDKLSADLEPVKQGLRGGCADRHQAGLIAFSQDGGFALWQINPGFGAAAVALAPGAVQRNQLGQAQPAGVEQFGDRVVAHRQKFGAGVVRRLIKQSRGGIGRERFR